MNKNLVLVSSACVCREKGEKLKWFLVKQGGEDKWELPKSLVRKGESSVRTSLRIMGEKGGLSTRVLEEVGRAGGMTTVSGRSVPQRHLYYLLLAKSKDSEAIGFDDTAWLDLSNASKKLSTKREKAMLKEAKSVFEKWKKARQKKNQQ